MSSASHDTQPIDFHQNARLIEAALAETTSQAFRSLLASFKTLKQYRDLLFDPKIHLKNDLTEDFIGEFMISDFNEIILVLRDYSGEERRGVREAYGLMDAALRELYKTDGSRKDAVDAIMDCRNNLHHAYLQLEHLHKHIENLD